MVGRRCAGCNGRLPTQRANRLYCSNACRQRARRQAHADREAWASRQARRAARASAAQASVQMPDSPTAALAPSDQLNMRAMPEDDPKRFVAAFAALGEEVGRFAGLEQGAQGSPNVAAFGANLVAAVRESGGRGTPPPSHPGARRIGPEHRHSEGEFAGRECYCAEPDAPVPAGAEAADIRERVTALEIAQLQGEPYVPLEGIAEGEPVRGDGATLAAMREDCGEPGAPEPAGATRGPSRPAIAAKEARA